MRWNLAGRVAVGIGSAATLAACAGLLSLDDLQKVDCTADCGQGLAGSGGQGLAGNEGASGSVHNGGSSVGGGSSTGGSSGQVSGDAASGSAGSAVSDGSPPPVDGPAGLDSDGDGIPDVSDRCPKDYFNDLDGDGICGDVDLCAVTGLTSFPAPTTLPPGITVTNVRIYSGRPIAANVRPGGAVQFTFDYVVKKDPCSCPTCSQEIFVGLAGASTFNCVLATPTCPMVSGASPSFSFTAPATAGTYYLSVFAVTSMTPVSACPAAIPDLKPSSYVGAICVR